jgi:hypothetical protein
LESIEEFEYGLRPLLTQALIILMGADAHFLVFSSEIS